MSKSIAVTPPSSRQLLRTASLLAVAVTLAGCETIDSSTGMKFVAAESQPEMSLAAAKRTIQRESRWYNNDGAVDHGQSGVNFEPTGWSVSYFNPSNGKRSGSTPCLYEKYDPYIKKLEEAAYGPNKHGTVYVVQPADASPCGGPKFQLLTEARAKNVAAAMLRWQKASPEERAGALAQEVSVTPAMVDSYARARTTQAIPEDVRRFKVAAEVAVREKRFVDAVTAYEDALDIAPWWGQGHFNAALVLAEIHNFRDAVNHMRLYLALTPGANDARQVQDKIYEWEDRLKPK